MGGNGLTVATCSLLLMLCGCSHEHDDEVRPAPTAAPATPAVTAAEPALEAGPVTVSEAGTLVRDPTRDRLYVADEDHEVVRVVSLPSFGAVEVAMPGPPAQLVVVANELLVTIRDPGLLMIFRIDADGLHERARVEVAADAWGLGASDDGATAVVTSAWSHRVTAVDRVAAAVKWSVLVAREPRGVAVVDNRAYVSHLMGAELTRVELNDTGVVSRVQLPAAPLRTPTERRKATSLGYVALASPDGTRLFALRRALGAAGSRAWAGMPTMDVLDTTTDTPLLEPEGVRPASPAGFPHTGGGALQLEPAFGVARAAVYRRRHNTVVVASESTDELVELDALALDPSLAPLERYRLVTRAQVLGGESPCGAPSGIALSEDESTAYVYCRSSDSLAMLTLLAEPGVRLPRMNAVDSVSRESVTSAKFVVVAPPHDDAVVARGRRLFFSATDAVLTDTMSCSACHPDGRDDGHVWQVLSHSDGDAGEGTIGNGYLAFPIARFLETPNLRGKPRQTPMLAGRVAAAGPYGWRAQEPDLQSRLREGFRNHLWFGAGIEGWGGEGFAAFVGDGPAPRAEALAKFVRVGLRPPRRLERPLTEEELRGRALFNSAAVGCARCHLPPTDFTDRAVYALHPEAPKRGHLPFSLDEKQRFRTPSLLFVGGTPPYFHDGSAPTLEALIEHNDDAMGNTHQLSPASRSDLTAYLETL